MAQAYRRALPWLVYEDKAFAGLTACSTLVLSPSLRGLPQVELN